MNKLALLPLLILPACASPGENARLAQAALDHDQALCIARGDPLGTDGYTRCMLRLGHRENYLVAKADDGNVAFALPQDTSIPGNPTGGGVPYNPPVPPDIPAAPIHTR